MPTNDICIIIEFLGDDMYIGFDGLLFRQTLAFLWELTALLLDGLFPYFYEKESK